MSHNRTYILVLAATKDKSITARPLNVMLVHLGVIPTITSPSLIYTFGCRGTLWELSVFFKNTTYWLQSKSESGSQRRHNVHTNSSRKRSLSKRFSNRRNLKTLSCYNVDRKHFDDFTMIMWFPHRVFLNYKFKTKITADCCVFKYFWNTVNEKRLMCFQSEIFD